MVNPFVKGQGAFIKITSLTVGLTVGLVLLAKVQLERNYDRCIVDKKHVYELQETMQRAGEEPEQHGCTSGGIAPVLAREIPEVVTATRYTAQFGDEKLTLEDGSRHYFEEAVFVDSCFFDIFATRTLVGDAKQILSTAGQCMISRRLSEKMGGEAIGQTFCFASAPQKPMTICGVYEDYPENSSFARFDILMSMPSVGTYAWDGTENLIGNDRYHSYVRLRPDADMEKVRSEVKQLLQRILPWEDLKQSGYTDAGYVLESVEGNRMKDTTVRTTCIILAVVALVMLFTAVMNYILVVISSLVGRARQVAVRKVLGAPNREFSAGGPCLDVAAALCRTGPDARPAGRQCHDALLATDLRSAARSMPHRPAQLRHLAGLHIFAYHAGLRLSPLQREQAHVEAVAAGLSVCALDDVALRAHHHLSAVPLYALNGYGLSI